MTAIIFGANGQDGYYLSKLLEEKKIEVLGIDKSENSTGTNIVDYQDVSKLIQTYQPEYLFHFAANSSTSHEAWKENHETISTGTLNILEAIKEYSPGTKLFLSGSGLQFRNEGKPIKETDPFDASSIYAVSRIHTVYAARYYRRFGLKIYIGYFFNHDSPLRTERHINRKIIDTVRRIAGGSLGKLEIGDLSVKKEYGFAGDIVKAVWALVEQDTINETVIGTGKAYPIEEWVSLCFSLYGLNWKDHVLEINNFVPEYSILVSDPSTIFSLGWRPEVSMEQLAKMMMNLT